MKKQTTSKKSEYIDYSEQYKHPKWQKKRLEILELHKYTCEKCNNEEKTLHVHHTRYIKGRNIWEYDNDIFECLCEDCHKKIHDKTKEQYIPYEYEEIYLHLKRLNDNELLFLNSIFELIDLYKNDMPDFLQYLANALNGIYSHKIYAELSLINDLENLSIGLSLLKNEINKPSDNLENTF